MPMINVKFDDSKVGDEKITELCNGLIKIVKDATNIDDVFAYADSPRIKIDVAPIEVFIEMSSTKVPNKDDLFTKIKDGISEWKKGTGFEYKITVTLIPVDWKFEVGI